MAPIPEVDDVLARPSTREAAWRFPRRTSALIAFALLLTSGVALAVAPTHMPASYSWVADTVSESAGQGVEGAWVARLGLLLYGFAVLLLAGIARPRWGRWSTLLQRVFGITMISAATFSARPWNPALPFDKFEDLLHSVAASTMGVAFAGGVFAVSVRRGHNGGLIQLADAAVIAASVFIPVAMFSLPSLTGALQRMMFVIGYAWYGREAVRTAHGGTQTQFSFGETRVSWPADVP
jgi:hypothetical protein